LIKESKTITELEEKIKERAALQKDPRLREVYSIAGGFIVERIKEESILVQTSNRSKV